MLRLGLAGMRVAEIIRLSIGDLRLGPEPTIEWIGKRNRPRKVAIGPALFELVDDYTSRYSNGVGRPLEPTDPVVCRQKTSSD